MYLKTRYGSQIFTFQLGEVTVTCKFNDTDGIVTVVQIRKSENLSSESSTPQNDTKWNKDENNNNIENRTNLTIPKTSQNHYDARVQLIMNLVAIYVWYFYLK